MNEAQMRSLVRAIELGSINAAARDLFVTPPSLHQRIVALEGELGCTLLERDRRGVRPTEEGKRLYASCVACLEHLDAARDDIAAMRRAGSLRQVCIGVAWRPSLRAYYAIESLHELMPELTVSVVKVTDKSLVDALVAGDIDIFESPRLVDESYGLEFWRFEEESYRCVCGPESRWAHLGLVTPDMLDGAAVYAGSDYRAYRSYLDEPRVQRLAPRRTSRRNPSPPSASWPTAWAARRSCCSLRAAPTTCARPSCTWPLTSLPSKPARMCVRNRLTMCWLWSGHFNSRHAQPQIHDADLDDIERA